MKTKEELNAIKKEIEALNKKLHELNEEELEQVTGGVAPPVFVPFVEKSRESTPDLCKPMSEIFTSVERRVKT